MGRGCPKGCQHDYMWEKFVETAGDHFRFLETEFGFVLKATKPPFVTYESDELQVLVFYDLSRGCELDLGIRRIGDDPSKVPTVGIAKLMAVHDESKVGDCMLTNPCTEEELESELKRLAGLFRKYGKPVLEGNLRDADRLFLHC